MMKKYYFIICLFILTFAKSNAQVAINTDGSDAHSSTMLDVKSSSKGVLIPRMTTSQKLNISNPSNGLLVFDETSRSFWFFNDNQSQWEELNVGNLVQGGMNDLDDGKTSTTSVYLGNNNGLNSTGNYNNSFGIQALFSNLSGESNISFGYQSLYNNTIGNNNIALSNHTLSYNQTGNNNIAIGYKAGEGTALHNKSGNIFLGYNAGYFETGNNKLYIENSNLTTPLIGGDFDLDTLAVAGDLSIYGNLQVTGGSPGDGTIMVSDTEGNIGWAEAKDTLKLEINDLYDGRTYNLTSTYLGFESGSENSTGEHNTAFGYRSLDTITTGNYNSALGAEALLDLETGSYNTAAGRNALSNLVSGNNNLAIGFKTGANNSTGSGNIFLGYQAGYNETGSNKLYIDISSTNTPLIYADFEADSVQINNNLEIKDSLIYKIGDLQAGKLLICQNTNGSSAWGTPIMSLDRLDDVFRMNNSLYISTQSSYAASNNTILGYVAAWTTGYGPAGSNNTILGAWTNHYNNDMSRTVALGSYAGPHSISSHPIIDNNIYIGHKAGYYSGSGENMLYIENNAGSLYMISGDFAEDTLSIISDLSIYGNLKNTGSNPATNKVLISDADGNASWQNSSILDISINDLSDAISDDYSVFLGYQSGINDDGTLNRNTTLGINSMYSNTNGYYNTAIGYNSLYSNTSGDYNVAAGYEALKSNNGNQNVAIGYQAAHSNTNYSNTISIGYQASAPGSNSVVVGNNVITQIGGYAGWSNLSDKRFKKNIKENVVGSEFIMKLRPVTYQLDIHKLNQFLGIEDKNPDEKSIRKKEAIQYSGFIAQEVEIAAQEVVYDFSGVQSPKNSKNHYSIAYAEFVVPLTKTIQEQMEEINQNEQAIDQLKREIEILKKEILSKIENDN